MIAPAVGIQILELDAFDLSGFNAKAADFNGILVLESKREKLIETVIVVTIYVIATIG